MQQTAVEWLVQQLRGADEKGDFIFNGVITSELIEEAKQMEAEQSKIPELSDEEINIGAINFCTKNIDTEVMHWSDIFEYACKWYREQLKQRQ